MMTGKLRTRLDMPSYELRDHLPIEIRNSRLALVTRVRHGEEADLAPGWYEVSAVLDDGSRHSESVQVIAGERLEVFLTVQLAGLMPASSTARMPPGRPKTRGSGKSGRRGVRPFESGEQRVILERVDGAELDECSNERWIFLRTTRRLESVPTAYLRIDDQPISVSLPINPHGYDDQGACVMTFTEYGNSIYCSAGFHPGRIVSAAIQRMLDKGEFGHATLAAEQTAETMLLEKYSDPVGAALGAIIMYRAGHLARRSEWLANLQHSFDWMPDGKILRAAVLGRSDEERAELLIRASDQRPMFTESLSILFDALRAWRSERHDVEISSALEKVASLARRVEWASTTLTVREL
ncbi:MAG: hypothetical protein AAGA68_16875 [Pseudomonadota bacterium]